ncbi:transposase [Frankia sp. AgB32]|nr:transposase [Frankia sp. AgB32]MCK9893106.1 transposase [Frankia sp. AgB32]
MIDARLSTQPLPAAPDQAGSEENPRIHFHFTPKGSSWNNQIETWFGIITKQSIRRGTFSSVKVLVKHIRDYIKHWNSPAEQFVLDRDSRGDSGQGQTRRDQHQKTGCQQ